MTEQSEPENEAEIREHESTRDDGGDNAEVPEGDDHGRDADPVMRDAPAPGGRVAGERPAP